MSKVIAHIRWVDSVGVSGWRSRSALKSTRQHLDHESVGYVLEETDYSLVIIQSQQRSGDDDHMADHMLEIPKAAIVERRDYVIEDFDG